MRCWNWLPAPAAFENMNLYNTTVLNLQQAKDQLAGYYKLDDIKDEF